MVRASADNYVNHVHYIMMTSSLGERYVMTVFGVLTFAQQGVYDIITNLGSLVARFIFLPIEESFYTFFACTLYRGEPAARQTESALTLSANTLSMLLKLVLLVALTILSFGFSYSFLALDIYGGSLLSGGEGPTLLRWYCVYVLVLGINGVTECFVFAAMSQPQVDRYNRMMLVFSVTFLSASLLLTRLLGCVGFVLANCVNMTIRILHSCQYIHKFFQDTPHTPLLSALPSLPSFITFLAAFIITTSSESIFCCDRGWGYRLLHIVTGAAFLVVVVGVVMASERDLLLFLADRLPKGVLQRLGLAKKKAE
jgi:oligosaccharide translocation protein RFT1